ncbi:cupin domain-containing protein [Streptomyces sp. NPDC047017]|uniref:cupin domain-containing protein n=1 Tax=Streptomyces sp. NPDC047017 TaxID=3155024 RepID=UPI0033DBB3AC
MDSGEEEERYTVTGAAGQDRPDLAVRLGLQAHPEGGWYRRLWSAGEQVDTGRGRRPAATAIHYLLGPGEQSRRHRVACDELWLWHSGSPLSLTHAAEPSAATASTTLLGPDPAAGQALWAAVPAGRWQCARPVGDDPVLVTCVVAPGFDWADFTLLPGDH